MMSRHDELAERYYVRPATAWIRAELDIALDESPSVVELFDLASEAGLRVHRFKRSGVLPRVRRVIGFLEAVVPTDLVDIGTGRGAFLWPLLDRFDELPVTCLDVLPHRIEMLESVRAGGVENLRALLIDASDIPLDEDSADVVCALEVLEHQESPDVMARQAVRVASRFVVASVPSKDDDNPEHVQLFTPDSLTRLFVEAGAQKVSLDWVPGHMVAMVTV